MSAPVTSHLLGKALTGAVALAMTAGVAACGSSSSSSTPTTSANPTTTLAPTTTAAPSTTTSSTVARGSGPVDVLYAGSLVNLMTKQIGPAFNTATGYTFTGFSGDSGSLATEIKGKVQQDRKSTRLNSSHNGRSRMPSSA